ncbi:hypothetical protein [Streptomyces sp. BPTC-684]|uniref:hypothetical protein n=1 Tax=Streptomyces sp. BPTC-684 TaxID=3043734 RepID=UPI0024B14BFE|nr:hypothetical protein [Streptomyces sp. BPTC-684]WHM36277.1 hypothetical protein QIY60_04595 [Streptomyces sp. BPTC-684]
MTTLKTRLVIALTGLITFTSLVITLLVLGQPAAVISPLILVIVLGVQQLLQALEGGNCQDETPRAPTPLPPATQALERNDLSAAEATEDNQGDNTDEKAA